MTSGRGAVTENSETRDALLKATEARLEGHGVDQEGYPGATVSVVMSSISRLPLVEEAFGMATGHGETIAPVERFLGRLAGERKCADRRRRAPQAS